MSYAVAVTWAWQHRRRRASVFGTLIRGKVNAARQCHALAQLTARPSLAKNNGRVQNLRGMGRRGEPVAVVIKRQKPGPVFPLWNRCRFPAWTRPGCSGPYRVARTGIHVVRSRPQRATRGAARVPPKPRPASKQYGQDWFSRQRLLHQFKLLVMYNRRRSPGSLINRGHGRGDRHSEGSFVTTPSQSRIPRQ